MDILVVYWHDEEDNCCSRDEPGAKKFSKELTRVGVPFIAGVAAAFYGVHSIEASDPLVELHQRPPGSKVPWTKISSQDVVKNFLNHLLISVPQYTTAQLRNGDCLVSFDYQVSLYRNTSDKFYKALEWVEQNIADINVIKYEPGKGAESIVHFLTNICEMKVVADSWSKVIRYNKDFIAGIAIVCAECDENVTLHRLVGGKWQKITKEELKKEFVEPIVLADSDPLWFGHCAVWVEEKLNYYKGNRKFLEGVEWLTDHIDADVDCEMISFSD